MRLDEVQDKKFSAMDCLWKRCKAPGNEGSWLWGGSRVQGVSLQVCVHDILDCRLCCLEVPESHDPMLSLAQCAPYFSCISCDWHVNPISFS